MYRFFWVTLYISPIYLMGNNGRLGRCRVVEAVRARVVPVSLLVPESVPVCGAATALLLASLLVSFLWKLFAWLHSCPGSSGTQKSQWANLGLHVVELSQYCYLLYILRTPSENVAIIMTEHEKDNLFVLKALYGGLLGGHQVQFLAQNSTCFTQHPQNPPFLGSNGPDSKGSHLPHILR